MKDITFELYQSFEAKPNVSHDFFLLFNIKTYQYNLFSLIYDWLFLYGNYIQIKKEKSILQIIFGVFNQFHQDLHQGTFHSGSRHELHINPPTHQTLAPVVECWVDTFVYLKARKNIGTKIDQEVGSR
jgi:hypothetical protein